MKRLRLKTIIACILLGLLITASGLVLFWHGTNLMISREREEIYSTLLHLVTAL